ncbi:helix-turn-helix domain-containing protein [Streptomyces sp. CWNU-52B]|uniref:helix-turn-helix domain-containing protein n=1 Tax=unclassified Streptomyces TaxID=2593676 RepID=UPI0039BFADBE
MARDEFTELLGQLKERSGLSYGVLAKRLHTSASTLHRYVNGDAVPADYAPVERFARACRATSEELVELHRRWVLADARRGQKPTETDTGTGTGTGAETGSGPGSGTETAGAGAGNEAGAPSVPEGAGPGSVGSGEPLDSADVLVSSEPPSGPAARRRRTAVLAGAAVAAAVVSVALVVNLVPSGDDDAGHEQSVGAEESAGDRPGAGESTGAKGKSATPSASDSASPKASASPSASRSGDGAAAAPDAGAADGASAPTVAVNPYKWEDPCSQHYLVDEKPQYVPPPASEPDARGWVTALGGVPGGKQILALTVQGTGKATVVLKALHVRVVEKSAPLAWNDFAMGVGCGGGVQTKSFGVNLDDGRPQAAPKSGQRDFPYKVSESDPEVFYVYADARAHNVSWYLELDWSSGGKEGTVRINDNGKAFRTSGNAGRPAYTYPLGDSEWGRNEYEPDVPG